MFSLLQPDPHGKGKKMSVMIDHDEIEKERLKAAAEEMLVMDLIGRQNIMTNHSQFAVADPEGVHFNGPCPPIFSSPEPKAQGELIVWDSSRRP